MAVVYMAEVSSELNTTAGTLFQQVGGTVGLAITGSIFSATFLAEVPPRLRAGVPEQVADRLTGGGSALNDVGGVGDLDVSILAQVPEQLRPQVEPIIPNIVDAIHAAFSIATGSTFAVGIFAALIAAALVLIVMPARRMGEGEAVDGAVPQPTVGELERTA